MCTYPYNIRSFFFNLRHDCRPVLVYFFRRHVYRTQLLMASGIGDKAELEAHGLDCIADVPELGKNLQVIFYRSQSQPLAS